MYRPRLSTNGARILGRTDDIRLAYPFFFRSNLGGEDDWSEFSTEHEFSKLILSSDEWRISHINSDFKVTGSASAAPQIGKRTVTRSSVNP